MYVPYAGFLQAGIAFYGRSCNIDIDTADGTVLMMYAVYCVNRLQDVLQRIVYGVFSRLQASRLWPMSCKAITSRRISSCVNFPAGYGLVLGMIRAVSTPIHTVIGEVEGGEHNDAVAVKALLYLACQLECFFYQVWKLAVQQNRSLPVRQSLALPGLLQNAFYHVPVRPMFFCITQCVDYLLMVNKLFGKR